MIRVLVVDDSPTNREAISAVLRADPDIEIVGEARNGTEAVELAEQLRPNVITMDVTMPGLNGFDATKEVMIRVPTPTLIVTGHFDVHDKVFTGNSFRAGAVSTLPKLPDTADPEFEPAAEQLVRVVKELSHVKVSRHWRYAPLLPYHGGSERVRAVAAAVSTHSARDFGRFVAQLPCDFPAALFVVAHVGHGFLPGFAAWLARQGG